MLHFILTILLLQKKYIAYGATILLQKMYHGIL
jgi:hypothetical protein